MSLVERIVHGSRTPPPGAPPARTAANPASAGATTSRDGAPASAGSLPERPFLVDLAGLRQQGVGRKAAARGSISHQVGHVRRRLMRELGLFDAASKRKRGRRLLITSAHPGEGKTFVALNLALSLALDESVPTLLFDADTVRAALTRKLGLVPAADEGPVLYRADNLPLAIVPVFVSHDRPGAGAEHRQVLDVLERTSADHRLVVIDSPPLVAMTDAAYVAQAVDHVVLVVGSGMTTPDDIAHAVELLGRRPNVSLVLNRARILTSGLPDYAYYGYARDLSP
jgi:protein-tyrosine kinase